jgi:hypothetical protein
MLNTQVKIKIQALHLLDACFANATGCILQYASNDAILTALRSRRKKKLKAAVVRANNY